MMVALNRCHAADSAFHKCAMPMSRHWGQRRLKRMSDIWRPVGSQDVGGPSARSLRKSGFPLPSMSFGHGAV